MTDGSQGKEIPGERMDRGAMTEVELVPMTETQYSDYRTSAEKNYARQIAESGGMTWAEAAERAARDYTVLLPDGLRTADQHLFRALAGTADVGMI
jgi:hypothetical protein